MERSSTDHILRARILAREASARGALAVSLSGLGLRGQQGNEPLNPLAVVIDGCRNPDSVSCLR